MSTLQQSLTNSMRAKLAGNEQLRNGKVLEARESYVEGLRQVLAGVEALRGEISRLSEENACENACVSLETVKCELEEVRVQLISNLSLTEIKLEMWTDALAHAAMVVVADPSNSKALFRKSVARIRLGEQLDEALQDLLKVQQQDPRNRDVTAEIGRCKQALKNRKSSSFQQKIRGTFEKQPTSSLFESIQKTLAALSATCGGLRPNLPTSDAKRG